MEIKQIFEEIVQNFELDENDDAPTEKLIIVDENTSDEEIKKAIARISPKFFDLFDINLVRRSIYKPEILVSLKNPKILRLQIKGQFDPAIYVGCLNYNLNEFIKQ